MVFVFPYRGIGGVSLLFLRLAEHIANKYKINTFIVDYENGYMAKNINLNLVSLIKYEDEFSVDLPGDSFIIFQTMTPWTIFPSLNIPNSSKLFFWNCHPYNLVPSVPVISKKLKLNIKIERIFLKTILLPYWRKCHRFLKLLVAEEAIAFMDKTNQETTEYFYSHVGEQKYLPIPVSHKSRTDTIKDSLLKSGTINAVWLGRIVDFKYYILKYTLIELNKISSINKLNIIFTVVGGGEFSEQLKKDIEKLSFIKIKFIDHIEPFDLDCFLRMETDVMFAMGTSALEAAKLGIPTILLDVFYDNLLGDYEYHFLFERDGSTLGDVIDMSDFNKSSNRSRESYNISLLKLLKRLEYDYTYISERTFEYFNNNHNIDKVSKDFLTRVNQSKLTYKDLKNINCLDNGIFYKLRKLFK